MYPPVPDALMVGCVRAGKTWYSRHQLSASVRFTACLDCCSARWHSASGCCQFENMANDADGANKGMSLVMTLVGWLDGAATMQQLKPLLQMLLSSFCVAAAAASRCSLICLCCSCFSVSTCCTPARKGSFKKGHVSGGGYKRSKLLQAS